jgi:starch synthase
MYPLIKTGGLADVTGALAKILVQMGHDAQAVLPMYRNINIKGHYEAVAEVEVPMGTTQRRAEIKRVVLENKLPVYLVAQTEYFDRDKLYGYRDDGERFIFFCRAVLELIKIIDFPMDVVHCNDWHTGMIPLLLRTVYEQDNFFIGTRTVFTIHNLGYLGLVPLDNLKYTGLPEDAVPPETVEFKGKLCLLKCGISYADIITTVSETYAHEIQGPELGCGLEAVLRGRSNKLFGILNGIDYSVWNPGCDEIIHTCYTQYTLEGKIKNKLALQRDLGLEVNADIPLIGMVSRLTSQKGLDILLPALEVLLNKKVQFILLGMGERKYHSALENVNKKYHNACILLKFDERIAHKIYAASDVLLMPSKFEPCGLSQLIALRYGAVPVVRRTGGLADTIIDYNAHPDTGYGFVFEDYSPEALLGTLEKALSMYAEEPGKWIELMKRGMSQDFSWEVSARKYVDLYTASIP